MVGREIAAAAVWEKRMVASGSAMLDGDLQVGSSLADFQHYASGLKYLHYGYANISTIQCKLHIWQYTRN